MINSILSWHRKKIVIDRLFINNGNQYELILDEETIKEKVNYHFQNIAVPINQPSPIDERWIEQYIPKEYINGNIYSNILSLPTMDEWIKIVNSLPNNKACDPSGIFNEYIKHLDDFT